MEKYHVLVVEDDKEIRDGIEIYLKSQGYEVFKAADGIEGLEIIYREEIHLAIVDVMMPRKDGIQMVTKTRRIRRACRRWQLCYNAGTGCKSIQSYERILFFYVFIH